MCSSDLSRLRQRIGSSRLISLAGFTLALILIGERYRDDALVRANAHVAQLWGIGCLLGPLATGAASQWISGHALPLMMALGAAGFVVLVRLRGAIPADEEATGLEASE